MKTNSTNAKTVEAMLQAYGTHTPILPETVRVLDEIITDYIIETAHLSTLPSVLAHRSKIKIDDFKFALRKDPKKLGRVTELLNLDRDIKRRRRAFEVEEGEVVQGIDPATGITRGKGRRGRRRKVDIEAEARAKAAALSGMNRGGADIEGSDEDVDMDLNADGEGEEFGEGRSIRSGGSASRGGRGGGAKRGRKRRKMEGGSSDLD